MPGEHLKTLFFVNNVHAELASSCALKCIARRSTALADIQNSSLSIAAFEGLARRSAALPNTSNILHPSLTPMLCWRAPARSNASRAARPPWPTLQTPLHLSRTPSCAGELLRVLMPRALLRRLGQHLKHLCICRERPCCVGESCALKCFVHCSAALAITAKINPAPTPILS